MRKNSLFLLGTVTGVCLTLALSGPHGAQLIAVAKAKVEGDVYSQLNLFGDVFERVACGGGGFGDPLERDPELVRKDAQLGLVSPRCAEEIRGAARSAPL